MYGQWPDQLTAETFDHFRVKNYTSVSAGLGALPPTRGAIRGHIHRGAFLVPRACRLFITDQDLVRLEPVEYGWVEHFGPPMRSECLIRLPQSYVTISACVQS